MSVTRLVTLDDVPALAKLLRANRDFLAPWEPVRGDGYFTADGQCAIVTRALARYGEGTHLPHVICDASGEVAGRINLNDIVRGAFQPATLGYWLGAEFNGRGLATAAVRDIIRLAFDDLGLHRIEAGTLVHNIRSQRVLERSGFVRFGLAPAYLNIAGTWQDHILYQIVKTSPA